MSQSRGVGGLGSVKMFQASLAQSMTSGKAVVIHLLRWFFMVNRTYEGILQAYEVRTL